MGTNPVVTPDLSSILSSLTTTIANASNIINKISADLKGGGAANASITSDIGAVAEALTVLLSLVS